MRTGFLALALLAALAPAAFSQKDGGSVALRAGTVHLVDGSGVLTGGATILIRDGKIQAVGKDVDLGSDVRIVDYGPDAVIVPGLIAASSHYALGNPSQRTADFGVRATDNLDFYSKVGLEDISAGVTSAYIAPTNERLIGGQGAVIKLVGDNLSQRLVLGPAAVDGSITEEARGTPGYWKPPVPATADIGLGLQQRQLPLTA